MLQIKIKGRDDFVRFKCPKCDSAESTYFEMPRSCWKCGYKHLADVEALRDDLPARKMYYLIGETYWRELDATATRKSTR